MKKIVFLSRLIPNEVKNEVIENAKHGMYESSIALQIKIIQGFDKILSEGALILCNVEPIGSWPQHYGKIKINSFLFDHQNNSMFSDYNVGFTNVIAIKQKSIELNLIRTLMILQNYEKIDAIIAYSPTTYFIKALIQFKKRYSKTKLCLVIPDLPDFNDMSRKISIKNLIYNKIQNRLLKNGYRHFDSMVLLTSQMVDYLKWNKPYVVIEGIADDYMNSVIENNDNTKSIVYTGTTHKKFGIPLLLAAFKKITISDIRLIICGCGDYDNEIRKIAETDQRILFLGVVSHDKAISIQRKASVLVNPRQNYGEYTRYSFPSKIMEYLSTGVPVVAYKLDGIPEAYNEYINIPDDNSIEALAEKISHILKLPDEKRNSLGSKGRLFVTSNMNSIIQAKKILNMLENC